MTLPAKRHENTTTQKDINALIGELESWAGGALPGSFTSVEVSGNIAVDGTVDGVDVSAHAGNANAHHDAFTASDHTTVGNGSPHHAPVTLAVGSDTALSLSGQELSLADVLTPTEHTTIGDSAPHHAAVTAGTLISLSGQQVSVDLTASPTWTGAHIFQGTTTTRHVLPEATDTYDLGSAALLWRRGYLSELDTFLLVENAISVIGGIQVIGHGQGTLAAALADGVGDTQINVGTGTNLAAGDFLLLRAALAVEYLEVVSDDGGGLFTVTRDLDGSGRNSWPAGAVWVNLGQTSDGRIELSAMTTPRIAILQQGATYNATTEVVRIGDLNGAFGVATELYGLGVGDYAGGNYLVYDPTDGFRLVAGAGGTQIDETGLSLNVAPDDAYPRAAAVTFVRSDDDSDVGDLAAQATDTHSYIRLESRRDSASIYDVASTRISSFLDGEHGEAMTYLSAWAHDRSTDPIVSFYLTASMDGDNDAVLTGADFRYLANLAPFRSDGSNYVKYTGRVLVASNFITRGTDQTATTSAADFLTTTPTVPAGRLVVTATVNYTVTANASYDFEARLIVDGTERDRQVATLLANYQRDCLTLVWVGDITAGARNIKVQIIKTNAAPTVVGTLRSRLSYQLYS